MSNVFLQGRSKEAQIECTEDIRDSERIRRPDMVSFREEELRNSKDFRGLRLANLLLIEICSLFRNRKVGVGRGPAHEFNGFTWH
jgi:hypothetical protein